MVFGVWGLDLRFGVWGLVFGVWGLGFGVWGLRFGVLGVGVNHHNPTPAKSQEKSFQYTGMGFEFLIKGFGSDRPDHEIGDPTTPAK